MFRARGVKFILSYLDFKVIFSLNMAKLIIESYKGYDYV